MPRKSTQVEKVCQNCGTSFRVKPAWADTRRYCSKQCMVSYETEHGRQAAIVTEMQFTCKQCGNPFSMKPGYVTEYRKKFGRDPLYCSIPCSALGRKADTLARNILTCEQCGKVVPMRRYEMPNRTKYDKTQRFCSQECKVAAQMDKAAAKFLAGDYGRHIKRNGYVWISVPANLNGGVKGEMLEHRYVMEQHLGRKLLPEETVHHVNGDRSFNEISNLELFSSRHGPGQRVADKVAFGVEMIMLYPDFLTREDRERLKAIIERDG